MVILVARMTPSILVLYHVRWLNNPDKRYKYMINLSNIYSLTPDTGAHVSGIEKESKRFTDSPAPLSFDMMFKTTEQQYGFGLHSPEQNDYDLYKR